MSADRLDTLLTSAIAAGLLPPEASRPDQAERPWPVLLLTALGAWLAALPLLGMLGMLFADLFSSHAGPWVIGTLALIGAVMVLRSADLALFVEQLAFPGLLVGGGLLAYGLLRDLPLSGAAFGLCLLALLVAALLPQAGLRLLLGVAACGALALACQGSIDADRSPAGWRWRLWLGWHVGLLLWLALRAWLERPVGESAVRARLIAEPIGTGWALGALLGLALSSGMSFLIGASLAPDGAGAVGPAPDAASGVLHALSAGSVLAALAAAVWLVSRWRVLRQPWCAGVAGVLLVLAWFMPMLGAVLLILAVSLTGSRWRLAGAAALAALWIVGAFYYQLAWSLTHKAALLAVAGLGLGLLASWGLRLERAAATDHAPQSAPAAGPDAAPPRRGLVRLSIGLSLLALGLVVNLGIWQKETLIRTGRPVFVELAPADPRSLLQGDYMALNYRFGDGLRAELVQLARHDNPARPRVLARVDERGVAQLERLAAAGTVPAADELLIELTPKGGGWTVVSDAWFFREGEAERWQPARYGEFRVGADGQALLVGLADKDLQPLGR
ncbi:MAG: hypothetical protein RLY71_2703 [Pseudomonadota bacterium]|jgi:uncharacterized membrane-anchored protein